jgi:LysR family transcriptional regulator, nitrogen assimilation regulatory protein
MDIRQLRYFVGVLEAKSLNKASVLLHVAQPALSTQIRNLERELGVKLLDRHARGIAPTRAGDRLAQHAYQLLRQVDRVRLDLSGYATAPSGDVVMSVAPSIPRSVTAAIAERCRRELPGVQLRIVERLRQQAQADRLTALALTFHPEKGAPFSREPLVQDELVLVCPANEGPGRAEIGLREVFQQPLILPSRSHCLRQLVEAAALAGGHELRIACEVDSFEVIRELVERNVAKAILPIAYVWHGMEKRKLKVAKIRNPRLQRTLYMLHSSRHVRSSAIDPVCCIVRAVIFECIDRESFGWRRIGVTERVSGDRPHDRDELEPGSAERSPGARTRGVFSLEHHP